MAKITYIEANGVEHCIDAKDGVTVMEAAKWNNVPGIDADCGGACACATCQVYIDPAWREAVGERDEVEDVMLSLANNVQDNSRLSCQIRVSIALDGLVVRLPPTQR